MLVFVVILLALVPAVAILYPFLRGAASDASHFDESATDVDLERRWDAAMAGLKNTELEWTIGNLTEEDYNWLRDQYTTEAALLMKAMDLEMERNQPPAAGTEGELRQADVEPSMTCLNCSSTVERTATRCSNCGHPLIQAGSEGVQESLSSEPSSE